MRAAENAPNSHILEPTDVDNDTNPPLHVRNYLFPPEEPTCACYQRNTRQRYTSAIHFAAARRCAPPLAMI